MLQPLLQQINSPSTSTATTISPFKMPPITLPTNSSYLPNNCPVIGPQNGYVQYFKIIPNNCLHSTAHCTLRVCFIPSATLVRLLSVGGLCDGVSPCAELFFDKFIRLQKVGGSCHLPPLTSKDYKGFLRKCRELAHRELAYRYITGDGTPPQPASSLVAWALVGFQGLVLFVYKPKNTMSQVALLALSVFLYCLTM
jgi:hypothetical protein